MFNRLLDWIREPVIDVEKEFEEILSEKMFSNEFEYNIKPSVKLVGITQPVGGEAKSAEDLIAYCARVSNPKNQENFSTTSKLLHYLMKNKHWSPFEMVDVVIEINTTRDIARQILRHRSFSFQEFSQRYANPTVDLSWATREARLQDHKNRQNSIEIDNPELEEQWRLKQIDVKVEAAESYRWALQHGIAKEVARSVLPEGLIMSRLYMKGSLRSWIHYCEVRTDMSTQKEHREIADQCWTIVKENFPFLDAK
jgi:thymidylate synthase (FAD)